MVKVVLESLPSSHQLWLCVFLGISSAVLSPTHYQLSFQHKESQALSGTCATKDPEFRKKNPERRVLEISANGKHREALTY